VRSRVIDKYAFSKALIKPLRSYNNDLEYIAGFSVDTSDGENGEGCKTFITVYIVKESYEAE